MATRTKVLAGLLATGGFVVLLAPPFTPAERFTFFGHGLCHQIPGHSFIIGGVQLPLCARCTGIYLGIVLSILYYIVRGRGRAAGFPPLPIFLGMLASFVFMGIDGVNSYVNLMTNTMGANLGFGPLYEPQNLLRISTGILVGATIGTMLVPVVNYTVWANPNSQRVVSRWSELLPLLAVLALAVVVVMNAPGLLAQPLALLSGVGIIGVFFLLGLVLVTTGLRRERTTTRWSQLAGTGLAALVIAVAVLSALSVLRSSATVAFNLPL
jgi:uncharacterized membrane protein